MVNESEKAVFGVSERRQAHQLQPIRRVLSEYYDRIDYLARHRDETIGVPTGFLDLDRLLGGMQPSDLLIIAGRPGQGKSGFCLSAAKNASQLYKKHVAVFSLEMSNDQLVQRLIAQETGIDISTLHYHWGDKANLYEAVILDITDDLKSELAEVEKMVLRANLNALGGNKSRTAELLGIGRKTLHRKIHDYGMEAEFLRDAGDESVSS